MSGYFNLVVTRETNIVPRGARLRGGFANAHRKNVNVQIRCLSITDPRLPYALSLEEAGLFFRN
jgi:hypothetical protein